ncbi:MAG: sigma-70 family RNA polymerase sigma factor [Rikenellaceae bacterium]|nr:sigma-70 family RNA polymerase sigma factor [Rikenellaceae bacterium]MCL2692008.1 sigma-70 family RNA polymerase sigma factor [Rikenellaceae bacterium]
MTDREIFELIRTNYDQGFERLFTKYYKSLVAFSCGMTGELSDSEDLVQTVFYKLVKERRFESVVPEKIRHYLFAAVRNATLNHIDSRRPARSLDSMPELFVLPADDETLYDDERIAYIKELIAALPPRTQQIVEDILVQNMKYKEVAEKYSISVNTVKMLLGRGLRKLRSGMSETAFLALVLACLDMHR